LIWNGILNSLAQIKDLADLAKRHRPLDLAQTSYVLYTVLATVFALRSVLFSFIGQFNLFWATGSSPTF